VNAKPMISRFSSDLLASTRSSDNIADRSRPDRERLRGAMSGNRKLLPLAPMLRHARTVTVAIALLAAVPSTALAVTADAHPSKGGVYVGVWRGGTDKVVIRVSRSGRSARAMVWCFKAFQGASPSFAISPKATFKGARRLAGELEWSVKGRFSSSRTAVLSVHLAIACSGIGSVKGLAVRLGGRAPTAPTSGSVSFSGFPDGTVLTTQTASQGAIFGSPQALAFPGTPPAYVCSAGSPTIQAGAAIAPACPGGPSGYTSSGTMARFSSPVSSVSVRVGSSEAVPGGFAAEVDAFTAAGSPVIQNAAQVGSSTNDQGAGPAQTVQLKGQSITYIALFFNSYYAYSAHLVFDSLAYTRS